MVRKTAIVSAVGGMVLLLGSIALKLTITIHQAPQPEAIIVLGGGTGREEAAAQLAKHDPELEVWVSSGDKPPQAGYAVFQAAGVTIERVHLDYRATDTVTNFTTLVAEFKQHDIRHLYLVTSDFHMPRATAIATLVLGSQGIAFTPIAVPSNRPKESMLRIVRDCARSLLWIVTRQTGENLGDLLKTQKVQITNIVIVKKE